MTDYYKCVYNGYNSLISCFTSFCNQDTTNSIIGIQAARDTYADLANPPSQNTQPTSGNPSSENQTNNGQTPGTQPGAQPGNTQTNQTGAAQPSGTVTTDKVNDDNSGATSNKITKIFVGFLALSALAMNFV